MWRTCDYQPCGKSYEAKRSTSKFCSSSCRVRSSQVRAVKVVVDLPKPTTDPTTPLFVATEQRLSGCGRSSTPEGVLALELARRIDEGGHSGSSLASLANAYAKALESATVDAGQDADVIDRIFGSA